VREGAVSQVVQLIAGNVAIALKGIDRVTRAPVESLIEDQRPAPSADRSALISDRDLLGAAFRISTEPVMSPAGVNKTIVPLIERDFTFPSAARPPAAVKHRSTTSSAVWADARGAHARRNSASANRVDTTLIVPLRFDPTSYIPHAPCDRFLYAVRAVKGEHPCDNRPCSDALSFSIPAATALFATPAAGAIPPKPPPAARTQDEWLDQAPEKHRVIFDTWMADKFGEAVGFAGNWIRINKDQYELTDADLAVVIVARHGTAPFAFNEAIWTKYGKIFADNMSTNNKAAHPNPSTNSYATRLANLSKQGMRLAVCSLTTRAYTQIIAKETGAEPDAIHKELAANAIGNAHFVPAGIVAVTRAQEHGYALASIG
jgi:intracellular sulfur oxidation DsrE/DsrF family protein